MTKFLTLCGCIFVFVLSCGLLIAAWPMLPAMALIAIVLVFIFATIAGTISLYYWLGKAKIQHATAYSLKLEAGKVAATNSVLVLDHQIIQLPNATSSSAMPARSAPILIEATVTPAPEGLPEAPTFGRLLESGFTPTPERMLLGYNHNGPLYASIDALLSTGVAGRPGQGKSSLLRFIYAQVTMLPGGKVFTLDPHGSITEDVQGGSGLLFDAGSVSEFEEAAKWIMAELDQRLKAYRNGQRDFKPIMGLVDELPVVSLASTNAKVAIGRIILEGRKVKMYSLISGQGLPADTLGGSLFRDALSSRYIFKTTEAQGRIAGLEKDSRKLLEGLEKGRAVFDGPALDRPGIVAVPFVKSEDLASLFSRPADHQTTTQPTGATTSRFEPEEYQRTPRTQEPLKTAYNKADHLAGAGKVIETHYRELPPVPKEIVLALNAYNAGATSIRSMRAALMCSQSQAIELLRLIKERYS